MALYKYVYDYVTVINWTVEFVETTNISTSLKYLKNSKIMYR